jgi:hypothetical protein
MALLVPKHGIESHYVRPDRVYATSVWSPVQGFQPVSNAMGVAAQFVQYGGLAGPGFLQRWRWRKQAQGRGFVGAGLGGFTSTILDWLRGLLAGLKARLMAYKIQKQLSTNGGKPVLSVDTSPRQTGAAQIVDAVRGLLPMPSATTPKDAATALSNQLTVAQAAPTVMPNQAAYAVAPGAADMTAYLSNQWRQGY